MRSGLVREPMGADPGDPKGTKPVSEGSGVGQSGKWRDSQGKVEWEEAGVRGTGVATPPPKQFSQGVLTLRPQCSSLGVCNSSRSPGRAPAGSSPTGPAQRQKARNRETSGWAGPGQVALARSWRELRVTGSLSPPHSLPARRFTLIRDALDETGNRRSVLS